MREDFSKAPPPEKRNTVPERHILVLGNSMADWLAYGLEDVYADQPEMGVIRKHKIASGLIKYQPKGDPADWAAAAKGILATEKADAIVVMLGLDDRVAIREPAADKSDTKPGEKKDAKAKPDGKPSSEKPAAKLDGASKAADPELPPDDSADNSDARRVMEPEKSAGSPSGLHEFREKRWVDLYREKIDEMIRVLKAKGVPVLWVGLPAVRGAKATADTAFLDTLYRDAAARPASPMSMSGTDLSMKPGAFYSKAPISKARSAGCAPPMACTSPRPARSSSRIMPSAKSTGCWPRVPRRSCCPPNRQPPTPVRGRISRRPVRWPGRSFPWWPLLGTDQLLGAPGSRQVGDGCAGSAALDQRRGFAGTRRSRRRFCLAATRNRARRDQGRDASGVNIARCQRTGAGGFAKAEKASPLGPQSLLALPNNRYPTSLESAIALSRCRRACRSDQIAGQDHHVVEILLTSSCALKIMLDMG